MARRRFAPTPGLGIAICCVAFGLTACGRSFDREAAVLSFSNANPQATTDQSRCVVDRLIDRYNLEDLELELQAEEPDPEFIEAQYRDMFACGMEGDVREQLVEQLASNGVSAEDAPCVADELVIDLGDDDIDVLLSGEITEAFFAKFLSAMETCGAVNS